VFSSALNPEPTVELGGEFGAHLAKHGDGVKDIAFAVDDVRAIFDEAVKRGGEVVRDVTEETDEHGTVVFATVKTYGDTVHTFINRSGYTVRPSVLWHCVLCASRRRVCAAVGLQGAFVPGYRRVDVFEPFATFTPPVGLDFVDHVVGNMPDLGMLPTVEWYERVLQVCATRKCCAAQPLQRVTASCGALWQFHRFWSVDDSQIHTEYSALRSIVMADPAEVVKMPINEPAMGKRAKSQIQEYVEYYGGAGVQHIALNTRDIITAISHLRARGAEFLRVPDTYYDALRARLAVVRVHARRAAWLLPL
jgi:4-hydroxyphenylpyruvate dioxygenase